MVSAQDKWEVELGGKAPTPFHLVEVFEILKTCLCHSSNYLRSLQDFAKIENARQASVTVQASTHY